VFVVGRLARNVPAKWPRRLWESLDAARDKVPLDAALMGWTLDLAPLTGYAPGWAFAWPPEEFPVPKYMGMIHALLCIGDCDENWSRVVLEAFAAGVPVIADRRGGFCEQLLQGEIGMLCSSTADVTSAIVRLATAEDYRLRLVKRAREALAELASPDQIGKFWKLLVGEILKA
jgi:glycosyltransferase involved in cell wall biosynthesis